MNSIIRYVSILKVLKTHIILLTLTVVCPTLSDPSNGRVDQRGDRPGDRASYTCSSGYELVGQSSRICQNNGQWSGDAPICES